MATTAISLNEFVKQYGHLNVRTYSSLGFVGMLCKSEDGTETFVSAPNPNGEHRMESFPYDGDKSQVIAFLKANRNDLYVIDGESQSGNITHTLCFSQFEDDTEEVF